MTQSCWLGFPPGVPGLAAPRVRLGRKLPSGMRAHNEQLALKSRPPCAIRRASSTRIATRDRSLAGRLASAVVRRLAVESVGPGAAQAFAEAAIGRDVLLYVHG